MVVADVTGVFNHNVSLDDECAGCDESYD